VRLLSSRQTVFWRGGEPETGRQPSRFPYEVILMMRLLVALAVLAGAGTPIARADDRALDLAIGDPARRDHQAPVVLDGITDTAALGVITPPQLAARLDGVRLLFVGESHTDIDFHRVQLRVLQELHRRGRTVLVGLEMYPVGAQEWLDRWILDPAMTEASFLDDSHWYRSWGYHWNYYRDIFLFARANRIRMFGVNVPREVVQTVRKEGFEALSPEQKALLPDRVDTDDAEHQQLFRAFFGDEDSLHGNLPEPMFQGLFRAQCTWDAAMGWNAVRALRAHGDDKAIMVVLVGSGHVAYGLGAERQARLWFDGRTASLIPVPVADDTHREPVESVRASYASFVWGLPPVRDPLYPSLGLSTPETKSGAHYKVIMVSPESVAQAAGFAVGDELLAMDGVSLDDKETTNRLMSEKRWGDSATYTIVRDGKEQTLTAYFRRRAPEPAPACEPAPAGSEGSTE
jgi:uncharacterized iron-regulated protein